MELLAKCDTLRVEREFDALKGFDRGRRWVSEMNTTCNECRKLQRFYCWWALVEEGYVGGRRGPFRQGAGCEAVRG